MQIFSFAILIAGASAAALKARAPQWSDWQGASTVTETETATVTDTVTVTGWATNYIVSLSRRWPTRCLCLTTYRPPPNGDTRPPLSPTQ